MGYRSKSISLEDEVWKAFDAARSVHGSYNKLLKLVLSAGGVFEEPFSRTDGIASLTQNAGTYQDTGTIGRGIHAIKPHSLHSGTRPIKGCAECAALKEKK